MPTSQAPSPKAPGPSAATDGRMDSAEVKRAQAEGIVKSHVIAGMGISLLPLPLLDTVALTDVQRRLIGRLADHYGVVINERGRKLAIAAVAGALPVLATGLGLSLLKVVPVFGSLAGAGTLSTLAAAITHAVGAVIIDHFESGGTLQDLDPELLRRHLRRELRRGWRLPVELATGVPL